MAQALPFDQVHGSHPDAIDTAASLAASFSHLTSVRQFNDIVLPMAAQLPIPVYVTDLQGGIAFHNPAAAMLWGAAPDDLARWGGFARLFHRDGTPLEHDAAPMARAAREGLKTTGEELVGERADGTRHTFAIHSMPLRGRKDAILGAVHVAIDVTERNRSEESAHRLAAIVESSDDAIISKQLDGTITSWNSGAERLFGYAAGDIIGRSVLTLIPEDRHSEETEIISRLRRGERLEHFETVRRHKSGRDVHISLTVSPIKRGDGTIVGASKIARDITAKKEADALLRKQTERLEALHRVSQIISKDLDLDRIVQSVTDEATALSGAQFGAFFYNRVDAAGESYTLYALSGAPLEAFERFGMPRNTAIFAPTFTGEGIVRSGDIRKDPRYGRNLPHAGMPAGHLPVVSYLAVPVVSVSGTVIGGLFFGHGEADRFGPETETLISAIAGQAAVAIDNARLHEAAQQEIARRKEAQEARELLLHEIKHRVKNTLATIQALASQTLKAGPEGEKSAFIARLHALSAAHDLLTTSDWQAIGMVELTEQTMAPFFGEGERRVTLAGPDVGLSPNKALLLTMVLHELGTNAVKYGALSVMNGKVAVAWSLDETTSPPALRLSWRESGGPSVVTPTRRGFGSRMIASALHGSDGNVEFDYHPDGLAVDLAMAL